MRRTIRTLVSVGSLVIATQVGVPPVAAGGFTADVVITKTVRGDAPKGASYTVRVSCPDSLDGVQEAHFDGPGTQTLSFDSSDPEYECTVTEPEDGGADRVRITPKVFTITYSEEDPNPSYDVRVVNAFSEAAEPVEVSPSFAG